MPKTTKRAATKRAAQIAKAHATELPKLAEVKIPPIRRSPGYKPPARGIARYPWATVLTVLIIGLGIYMLYYYHVGPFALPKPAAKSKVPVTSVCAVSSTLSKITDTSAAPNAATFDATKHSYPTAPTMSIDTKKTYCAGINTNRGLIVVELDPSLAPNTVNNFVFLAQNKFYDGMVFHRVLQTGQGLHIIQSGDPLGKDLNKRGTGGPGYKFADEPVKGAYTEGAVAMANSGANTNGSQFFICTGDDTSLPKSYNLFGRVVKGIEIAKQIQGPGDDAATKGITPDTINHVVVVAA
ncbi:MAG: hypothetical protein NVS4B12_06270 [Ktedonobacteraceae bacterium]